MDGLTIPIGILERMRAQVDPLAPLEACGLLAGREGRVQALLPVPNKAASSTRFLMDPIEQLRAFDWIESHGMELLAIYHSHPAGPAEPSATDIEEAAYEVVHLIWSRPDGTWSPRLFRIEGGRAREVSLQVVPGEPADASTADGQG